MSFNRPFTLRDGSIVDLNTQEGADAFLGCHSLFNPGVTAARRQKNTEQLMFYYTVLQTVSLHASPAAFSRFVPASDLKGLVEHMSEVFVELKTDEGFLKTGILTGYDQRLLEAISGFMAYVNFVAVALTKPCKLLPILAEWLSGCLAARGSSDYLTTEIGNPIVDIIFFGAMSWMKGKFGKMQCRESTYFKLVEKSGFLQHFLRYAEQPHTHPTTHTYQINCIFDSLIRCVSVFRERMRIGSATGDLLRSLYLEDASDDLPESVFLRVENLVQISDLVCPPITNLPPGEESENGEDDLEGYPIEVCRNCHKLSLSTAFQKSLLLCSRCKGKPSRREYKRSRRVHELMRAVCFLYVNRRSLL